MNQIIMLAHIGSRDVGTVGLVVFAVVAVYIFIRY